MTENSKIAWTDNTYNPWIGCDEISPACDHCYARDLAKQYGWAQWGPKEPRHRTSAATLRKPYAWQKAAVKSGIRTKVFCLSLGDVADKHVPQEWRDGLKQTVHDTPNLDWLFLTKRPQNIIGLYGRDFFAEHRNIWMGCTAENQEEYDRRRLKLFDIPASIYFFSVEPMLSPVIRDLTNERDKTVWYICGGESGTERRDFNLEWAESLRRSCAETKTPFFFKQDSALKPGQRGRASDALWNTRQFPVVA